MLCGSITLTCVYPTASHDEELVLQILFVCTGNICRSPIAERLALRHGQRLEIPNFRVSSAGTRAVIGHTMHHQAARVLESLGGDASAFAARQLTAKTASSASLVLTMTRAHRDAVLELAPNKLHKTFTLAEASLLASDFGANTVADLSVLRSQLAVQNLLDVPDPIGQNAEVFHSVGTQIADLLPAVIELCRRDSASAAT